MKVFRGSQTHTTPLSCDHTHMVVYVSFSLKVKEGNNTTKKYSSLVQRQMFQDPQAQDTRKQLHSCPMVCVYHIYIYISLGYNIHRLPVQLSQTMIITHIIIQYFSVEKVHATPWQKYGSLWLCQCDRQSMLPSSNLQDKWDATKWLCSCPMLIIYMYIYPDQKNMKLNHVLISFSL